MFKKKYIFKNKIVINYLNYSYNYNLITVELCRYYLKIYRFFLLLLFVNILCSKLSFEQDNFMWASMCEMCFLKLIKKLITNIYIYIRYIYFQYFPTQCYLLEVKLP